ncbi:MAG: L7Ae/L30e/S12e/Gadd45 family ribosomal protein [Gemmatimonadota bacterium]
MKAKRKSGRADALSFLGLARRAGAVVKGTDATRRALRNGEVALVLTAEDASPAQLEKVLGLLRHGTVPYRTAGSRAELGAAVGSAPLSTLAVTKASFADQIVQRLGSATAPARGPGSQRAKRSAAERKDEKGN